VYEARVGVRQTNQNIPEIFRGTGTDDVTSLPRDAMLARY